MKGDKRERIIRILLNNPDGGLTAYRIHLEAECSQPWALSYLKKLENMAFLKKTKVNDVYGLFEYWLKIRSAPQCADYHLKSDPLKTIRSSGLSYALTTYQAENLLHGYLFPTRTDFYILPDELNLWHNHLITNGLVGAGNTRVIIADPAIVNKQTINHKGYALVSRSQLICDLLMEGGVAMEAATMLISEWYSEVL
ncbi:MAG: hypothetical protein IMZ43_03395 [Thermoplasmata archaeon]|nr:hypothetical protein [Thermoplasmata archaeon]